MFIQSTKRPPPPLTHTRLYTYGNRSLSMVCHFCVKRNRFTFVCGVEVPGMGEGYVNGCTLRYWLVFELTHGFEDLKWGFGLAVLVGNLYACPRFRCQYSLLYLSSFLSIRGCKFILKTFDFHMCLTREISPHAINTGVVINTWIGLVKSMSRQWTRGRRKWFFWCKQTHSSCRMVSVLQDGLQVAFCPLMESGCSQRAYEGTLGGTDLCIGFI